MSRRGASNTPSGCSTRGRSLPALASLSDIVRDYRAEHAPRKRRELRFYEIQRSLSQVLDHAAAAALPSGKRHPHQYRLSNQALADIRPRLHAAAKELRACTSFHELYELLEEVIGDVHGIGALMLYDTAIRIGAFLGLQPDRVYLHRGVRDGAKALGLDVRRPWISVHELPGALKRLSADEAEDVLCIYKSVLGWAARGRRAKRPMARSCVRST